jgi:hypothetical protein
MNGPISIFNIKISGIDAGIVGRRVSLNSRGSTGILVIRSAAGADKATAKIKAITINLMIRNLLSLST